VVSRLVRASVPAVGVSLFPSVVTASRRLEVSLPGVLDEVAALLDRGFVPVLHGDAVLDLDQVAS
jgi:isopentenyl phosphate kinase